MIFLLFPPEFSPGEVIESDGQQRTLSGRATSLEKTSPSSSANPLVPAQLNNKNTPPAALRLLNSRASKYGTWNGAGPSPESSGNVSGPTPIPTTGIPERGPAPDYSLMSVQPVQQVQRPVGAAFGVQEKGPEAGVVSDIDRWAKEIQERHHTQYMKDLENRLSHARAALASFPTFIQDAVTELEKEEEAARNVPPAPPGPSLSPAPPPAMAVAPIQKREPVYVSMDETDLSLDTIMAATSSGIEVRTGEQE